MNVDCHNFGQVYQFIVANQIIQRSSTISVDLEFTGLKMDNNDKQRYDEFVFERYQKLRPVATKYNIIQIGLCFFIQQGDQIIAYPYNFYVFPRSYRNVNPVVSLQSGTVDFNSKNGMDWNRWIKDGVTYMPLSKIQQALYVPEKASLEELKKKLTMDQIDEVTKIQQQLKLFVDSKSDTLEIEATSTFMRLIIERQLEKNFKNMYLQPYNSDSSLKQKLLMSIRKTNSEDRKQIQKRLSLELFGFTKIFEKIWEYKVKIVAHNSLLDLLYIYQSFVGDLPDSYYQFKKNINKGFPYFYDTKFLSNQSEFQSKLSGTSLEDIQSSIIKDTQFFKSVNIKLAPGFEKYDWTSQSNQIRLHEAGYDAYLTGWIFYHLIQKMDYKKHESKLKIIWSMYDMNLKSSDDEWNDETKDTFCLILALRRPKQSIPRLFQYRRNLLNYVVQKLKFIPQNTSITKDEIKYKQCRLEYLVVECKNLSKKKQFIQSVQALGSEEIDVLTMNSFLKEKKQMIQKLIKLE